MDGRIFSAAAAAAAAASHSCIATPHNDFKTAGAAYSSSSSLEWLSGNQLHTFNFNTVLCYMCQPERSFISEIHRKYTHTYVYVDQACSYTGVALGERIRVFQNNTS